MKMLLWLALLLSSFFWVRINSSKGAVNDITYTLPEGWKAAPESWGIRFVAPAGGEDIFKPEVTLRIRKGPIDIDDVSGKDFIEVLKRQLSAGGWSNINLRQPRIFDFRPDFKGLLYYANIEAAGNSLDQSIAVFSSQSEHYVFTYTDLPEHFQVGQDKTFQQSFQLVRSFQHPDGWARSKMSTVTSYGFAALFLLVSVVSFLVVRNFLARRAYERLAVQVPDEWGQDQIEELVELPEVTAKIKSETGFEKDEDVV